MLLDDYRIECKRTAVGGIKAYYMGLFGETGEMLDVIKKEIFHQTPINRDNLIKELGDCMWYITMVADTLKIDLRNIKISTENIFLPTVTLSLARLITDLGSYMIDETLTSSIKPDRLIFSYISILNKIAEHYTLDMSYIMEKNIEKLKIRYKEKFTPIESAERVDTFGDQLFREEHA